MDGKILNFNDYDLFIVDFDGTIVDTMKMWKSICLDFVRSLNVEINDDLYKKIASKTNIEICHIIRDDYLVEYNYEEVANMFFEFVKAEYIKQDLKVNAIELLKDLNNSGKVVLYSATAGNLLNVLLDKIDIRKYFKSIYSGSDLGLSKENGTGYLEVIKFEGGCNRALVLEDALHAMKGAKNYNLDVLAIVDYSNINHLDEVEKYSNYIIDLNKYYKSNNN
jgi:beta-phosphoglucomutase-like phosphatase (HAD superfamily)